MRYACPVRNHARPGTASLQRSYSAQHDDDETSCSSADNPTWSPRVPTWIPQGRSHKTCLRPKAYLAGLTFALVASPCSTPVLATLLAYVATAGNPVAGGALLLCYTSGYVGPLLAAAAFTVRVSMALLVLSLIKSRCSLHHECHAVWT